MSATAPSAVALRDGRTLSYYDLGDPAGRPVFLFHGTPQAAVCWTFADGVARELRVRAIAPDRPGIGLSTFQTGRRLVDWPNDVAALADLLGIKDFATLGWSAGGPYALACGALLPGRVSAVGVGAGVCPHEWVASLDGLNPQDARLVKLVRRSPRLAAGALAAAAAVTRASPAGARRLARRTLTDREREEWDRHAPEVDGLRFLLHAFEQGAEGVVADYLLYADPWGFDVEDVRLPVRLWHGDADSVVPLAHAELLAGRLPHAVLTVVPDAGHLLPYDTIGEMLEELTASPSGA